MKYGFWNVQTPEMGAVNALVTGGYAPLSAMVLASRGMKTAADADRFLRCDCTLPDPYLMTDMDLAVGRVALAMTRGEKIAVFGDYDVDGITATCLLTHFLRSCDANVVSYIPGRLEEGYGLNPIALHQLHEEGVKLIISVDCGITAVAEAQLCKELGIDRVITEHHECKDVLPEAVAVVNPHRPDSGYPHMNLSGVGVAFKLACALSGDAEQVLAEYADMVCLGTVADVMPLVGENRVFVDRGLQSLRRTHRPGIATLMAECNCTPESLSAHFQSLLQLSADQVRAGTGIDERYTIHESFYTQVLKYVAENGVYSYGCYVCASPAAILKLIESGAVSSVNIEDIWISN